MSKIRVIIKRPDEPVGHYETIPNTLKALQQAVGGYIETVTIGKYLAVICNEEGRIRGLPYNCHVCDIGFLGTIIAVGVDGEEFTDVPITLEDWKEDCLEAEG